jgi:hypothetical protein
VVELDELAPRAIAHDLPRVSPSHAKFSDPSSFASRLASIDKQSAIALMHTVGKCFEGRKEINRPSHIRGRF